MRTADGAASISRRRSRSRLRRTVPARPVPVRPELARAAQARIPQWANSIPTRAPVPKARSERAMPGPSTAAPPRAPAATGRAAERARAEGGDAKRAALLGAAPHVNSQPPTTNDQLPTTKAERIHGPTVEARRHDEARAGGGSGASARQLPTSNYQLPRLH